MEFSFLLSAMIFLQKENFQEVLNKMLSENIIKELQVSPPKPYLPDNEEFADKIQVHYITFKSA